MRETESRFEVAVTAHLDNVRKTEEKFSQALVNGDDEAAQKALDEWEKLRETTQGFIKDLESHGASRLLDEAEDMKMQTKEMLAFQGYTENPRKESPNNNAEAKQFFGQYQVTGYRPERGSTNTMWQNTMVKENEN